MASEYDIVIPPDAYVPAQFLPPEEKAVKELESTFAVPPSTAHSLRAASYWALSWLSIALVIYGSLIPFGFRPAPELDSLSDKINFLFHMVTAPRWGSASTSQFSSLGISAYVSDWAVNILLYVPVGIFLSLHLMQRGLSRFEQFVATCSAVFGLSWMMECIQGLEPARVSSLQDVLLNFTGGSITALITPWLAQHCKVMTFEIYKKISILVIDTRDWLVSQRRRPLSAVALFLFYGFIVVNWYIKSSHNIVAPGHQAKVYWMPFAVAFHKSYDIAAMMLGREMLVDAVLCLPLAMAWVSLRDRRGFGVVMLCMAVLGTLHEVIDRFNGHSADITGSVLAVLAALTVLTTASLAQRAVWACCRRRESVPVANDRRRRRHNYTPEQIAAMRAKNAGNMNTQTQA